VADFTYCSTWLGIVYVAFVVDAFSRRIVGRKASRTILFTSGGAAGETPPDDRMAVHRFAA
jgi:transposase InsO family protein